MNTALLISGGLDSSVLLAEEAEHGPVQPIYVRAGFAWEAAELAAVRELLTIEPLGSRTRPLVSLTVDMRDVYEAGHWAIEGRPPRYHTPDEDVYLPGRNVILLGKAGVYCAAARIDRLVLGTLAHNPFPDATAAFRSAMGKALSLGLAHPLTIDAPLAGARKGEVIRRGAALGVPLRLTLSCMNPTPKVRVPGVREVPSMLDVHVEPRAPREPREPREPRFLHCGTCSKCRERHEAFLEAGIVDETEYAEQKFVTGEIADR
jgi:7-cyano-7-deazaguanine synthase